MKIRYAFAKALKKARKAHGLTQEDFSAVSSRTYLSTLERGKKSPTLEKINVLADTIGIHLLSLLTLAYLNCENGDDVDTILERVKCEISKVNERTDSQI